VKVQIHYSDGCPNWRVAKQGLREALDLVGDFSAVERCPVKTYEEAELLPFGGPPTILINGQDPVPSGSESYGFAMPTLPNSRRSWRDRHRFATSPMPLLTQSFLSVDSPGSA